MLSAQANGIILLVVSALVTFEVVTRLLHPLMTDTGSDAKTETWDMTSKTLHRTLSSAGVLLSCTALAACASRAPASLGAPASSSAAPASSAAAGYPGYRWQLVSISHAGKVTPIPARYSPIMQFSPDGQFFASDGIHGYSGTYRAASDAFTTKNIAGTTNGSTGNDPITALTISAMGWFLEHARHPVRLTGDRLVVNSGSYALTYNRAGRSG